MILTAEELAERWSVSKDWIYLQVRQERIPRIPLPGRVVRFRLDTIEAFERGDFDGEPKAVIRS